MDNWHDYLRTDKMLLAVLILIFLSVWIWTRSDKVFDLINTANGALLGLITGLALGNRRNGNGAAPVEKSGPPVGSGATISRNPS